MLLNGKKSSESDHLIKFTKKIVTMRKNLRQILMTENVDAGQNVENGLHIS